MKDADAVERWAASIAATCANVDQVKEENGRQSIDRATFQSFDATAIAVARCRDRIAQGQDGG